MAKPSKISKFFRNLLTVLLVVIILCTLGLNLLFQNDNSAPFIFGNGFYIMRQVNILDVSYGDVVISNKNKISEIQPGNVVLCLTSYDDFKEVLRVQEIVQEDGVTYYMVRSDDVDDQPRKLSADKIIAKCTYTNSILGSVIGFVKSWQGIAVLVGGSGIILVLMYLTSYSAKHEEELREEREEEERKNRNAQNRNRQKRPNPNGNHNNGENRPRNSENGNNPNRPKNPNNRRPKNANPNGNDSVRPRNKSIAVTQLSEEESIKQRQNVSNMIGSELDSQTREITREFNSAEVIVSQPTNFEAIKIHEGKKKNYSSEGVHSPNMEQKAVEIKKALSQNDTNDNDVKSVSKTSQEDVSKVQVKEPTKTVKPVEPIVPITPIEPVEDVKPVEKQQSVVQDKQVQQSKVEVSQDKKEPIKKPIVNESEVTDTVIVIPKEFQKSNQDKSAQPKKVEEKSIPVQSAETPKTSKPKQEQSAKPVQQTKSKPVQSTERKTSSSNIDNLLNNDDNFLNDLFNNNTSNSTSDNAKVSDDILDQLLSTIPSTHPTEQPVEHVKPEIKKPVHTTSSAHKKTTNSSTTTHHAHKSTNKKVDSSSFDELLKAIEKEKNNIK